MDKAATDIAGEANKGTITEEYIERRLSSYGIGYTYVEKLDKAPVDAYSSIINGTPYIVVSHRYNNMDMLVFDVLHELHHIDVDLVEGASNVSFNRDADDDNDEREMAANKYAEDMLIPKATWEKILKVQRSSDIKLNESRLRAALIQSIIMLYFCRYYSVSSFSLSSPSVVP